MKDGVLIETLWNVNNFIPVTLLVPLPVLIETLWNVNVKQSIIFNDSETVLIETLWNVNQEVPVPMGQQQKY